MEENVIKKETKFIDNVAYKNKFQFILWVNNNAICQRYFKINGFIDDSIYTEEFQECMNEIVDSIQNDLKSKSNVFMWYTNPNEPLKLVGFLNERELDEFDKDIDDFQKKFFFVLNNTNITGKIQRPDGKIMEKEYHKYGKDVINDFGDIERPKDGEITFKFTFLIDDKPVFERIWDGNVYPRFVRNGVDLTNSTAYYTNRNTDSMSIGQQLLYKMQAGKTNLINEFIRKICDTLSNTFTDKNLYTKRVEYKNNNVIDKKRYEEAVKFYGDPIKPIITGHVDIKEEDKEYDFLSNFEAYKQSFGKEMKEKTNKYFYRDKYMLEKSLDFWEKR